MTSHVYFWYQITAAHLSRRDTVLTFQCCLVVWVTSAESGSGTQFHNTTITFLFNLLFIIEAVIIFLLTTPQACRLTPQQQINPLILLPAMCNLLTFLSERERRCKKGFSLSLSEWRKQTRWTRAAGSRPTAIKVDPLAERPVFFPALSPFSSASFGGTTCAPANDKHGQRK